MIVLRWINSFFKFLSWVMLALLILAAAIGYMTVVSIVWAISSMAGLGLLAFALLLIAFVFYC